MHPSNHPFAYGIKATCSGLGISRSLLYNMIRDGRVKSVKIAGRTLIPCSEIERLLSGVANDA
ncbi:MAG: helix-turn-helix domain-containing protein [Phyllobacteriaceae bacterium]|nr:helix-turn-helix domain-containing protein [Phyllobacteriaceae bacterium]